MYGNLEGIMRVTFNAPGSLVSRCETALFRTFTGTFSFFFFNSFTNSFISSKLLAAYELAVKRCDGGRQHEVDRGLKPPRLCWSVRGCACVR